MSHSPNPAPRKAGRIALLGVVLPFLGVVIGAVLEHGAGFVCRTGLTECAPTASEAGALEDFVVGLQESHSATQSSLSQCQMTLDDVLAQLSVAETRAQASDAGDQAGFLQALALAEGEIVQFQSQMPAPEALQFQGDVDFEMIQRGFPDLTLPAVDFTMQ